jgi:peptidoglycan-associated lipoprotein
LLFLGDDMRISLLLAFVLAFASVSRPAHAEVDRTTPPGLIADLLPEPPTPPAPELVIDRIVLDERVVFDKERARVKRAARKVLAGFVGEWKLHPEWDRVILEGHTDERGPELYNRWLALERAMRVREYLLSIGVPPDRVEAVTYGKSRPRAEGHDDAACAENRRVELVILRRPSE